MRAFLFSAAILFAAIFVGRLLFGLGISNNAWAVTFACIIAFIGGQWREALWPTARELIEEFQSAEEE